MGIRIVKERTKLLISNNYYIKWLFHWAVACFALQFWSWTPHGLVHAALHRANEVNRLGADLARLGKQSRTRKSVEDYTDVLSSLYRANASMVYWTVYGNLCFPDSQ